MILVDTDHITGKALDMLGLVKGSTTQTKDIGKDTSQGFKMLIGDELKMCNEMMNETRILTTKRMVEKAEALSTNTIVDIRYVFNAIMGNAAEVIAYGTTATFL